MTTINSFQPIYNQTVTFKANVENTATASPKPEKHPGVAVLSYVFPGTGQLLNGETKTGLKHLVIDLSLMASGFVLGIKKVLPVIKQNKEAAKKVIKEKGFVKALLSLEYFKARLNGVSKKTVAAGAVIWVLSMLNGAASSMDAYNGKKIIKHS
ncbi:MAG TPA: hypothetical protein DDW90_11930 [Cyanobacteria bacterium UBA9971]|nr:hypothetical protein [Cyanobacteria bacterium UBA9971]